MRELILSLGLTVLTAVLLFVYFRNKHNKLDDKVNLVFQTIQDHNEKMQRAAEEEIMRARAFENMQNMQSMDNMDNMENPVIESMDSLESENVEDGKGLIDISEDDSGSDSDDDEDEDEEDDNSDDQESVKSLEEITNNNDNNILPPIDYTKLTKAELKKLCDEKDINYSKSANKAKLVELLIGFESPKVIKLSEE